MSPLYNALCRDDVKFASYYLSMASLYLKELKHCAISDLMGSTIVEESLKSVLEILHNPLSNVTTFQSTLSRDDVKFDL